MKMIIFSIGAEIKDFGMWIADIGARMQCWAMHEKRDV